MKILRFKNINEYQSMPDFSDEVDKFDISIAKLHDVVEQITSKQQFDLDNQGYSHALRYVNHQLDKMVNDLDILNKSNVIS